MDDEKFDVEKEFKQLNRKIFYLQEQIETTVQKLTEIGVYVRRNSKRLAEAMTTLQKAWQLTSNAQYNLREELSEFAGNMVTEGEKSGMF